MKIALCGVTTSLCVTIMFLTGLIPSMTYSFPAIAGVLMTVIVIEVSKKWAWTCFLCASIISVLIVPDKEASLAFIMFFGYFPIVKASIERIKIKGLQLLIKFLLFNAVAVSDFFIAAYVLSIPQDMFSILNIPPEMILLVLANITFFLYDIAVSLAVYRYMTRIHPTIKKMMSL